MVAGTHDGTGRNVLRVRGDQGGQGRMLESPTRNFLRCFPALETSSSTFNTQLMESAKTRAEKREPHPLLALHLAHFGSEGPQRSALNGKMLSLNQPSKEQAFCHSGHFDGDPGFQSVPVSAPAPIHPTLPPVQLLTPRSPAPPSSRASYMSPRIHSRASQWVTPEPLGVIHGHPRASPRHSQNTHRSSGLRSTARLDLQQREQHLREALQREQTMNAQLHDLIQSEHLPTRSQCGSLSARSSARAFHWAEAHPTPPPVVPNECRGWRPDKLRVVNVDAVTAAAFHGHAYTPRALSSSCWSGCSSFRKVRSMQRVPFTPDRCV